MPRPAIFSGPTSAPLSVSVGHSASTSQVCLTGEFDLAGVRPVEHALDLAFQAPATRRVVFDLRRLTFLDGAGLRTILRAHQRALAAAIELIVVRPHGLANRVFTLTRAGQQLSMVDEPEVVA
jgi:anti-anti-sigma factor